MFHSIFLPCRWGVCPSAATQADFTSILPPGAGDRELGCIKCFPCSSSSRLSFLLLLFFSFPPSSFHIFFRFFVNFCVLFLFNCKMRSSIAFGANNVALPSTISRKQDPEIAKSRIFLAHVSAPNLTNATCTWGVAQANFKTSTFLTFWTHFGFSQKTYIWYDYRGQTQFWGVSLRLLCQRSHERRIPPCPRLFFNLMLF